MHWTDKTTLYASLFGQSLLLSYLFTRCSLPWNQGEFLPVVHCCLVYLSQKPLCNQIVLSQSTSQIFSSSTWIQSHFSFHTCQAVILRTIQCKPQQAIFLLSLDSISCIMLRIGWQFRPIQFPISVAHLLQSYWCMDSWRIGARLSVFSSSLLHMTRILGPPT